MSENTITKIKNSPENFTVQVAGHISLEELDQELNKNNQESLLIAPKSYTIHQILSENWNNACHKSCLGLELEHKDGMITKTGGQVIKNVSGYDLSKVYIGSDNELVKIKSAYLRTISKAKSLVTINHQLTSLPKDLHNYIFNWDNCVSKFIIHNDHTELEIKLWEEDEILELRQAKLLKKLDAMELSQAQVNKSAYQKTYEPDFQDADIKLEIYSKVSDLYKQSMAIKELGQINIYPEYGKIEIYNKASDINKDALQQLNNAYTHIYPVNNQNKKLEQEINPKQNQDEAKLYQKIKELYC